MPHVPLLSQINPLHTLSYNCIIHLNTMVTSMSRSTKVFLLSVPPHHSTVWNSVLPLRATCPAHPVRLHMKSLTILGEQWSSSLCSTLQSPAIPSLLVPIHLLAQHPDLQNPDLQHTYLKQPDSLTVISSTLISNTPISNTLSLRPSLHTKHQHWQQPNTTAQLQSTHVNITTFTNTDGTETQQTFPAATLLLIPS